MHGNVAAYVGMAVSAYREYAATKDISVLYNSSHNLIEADFVGEYINKILRNLLGNSMKFMPANTFVLFPDGDLGNTWFGTTPAESDLMGGSVANVSIVDTGVAITTAKHVDPVNVETIVSQICLPSFEMADQVFILDTTAA